MASPGRVRNGVFNFSGVQLSRVSAFLCFRFPVVVSVFPCFRVFRVSVVSVFRVSGFPCFRVSVAPVVSVFRFSFVQVFLFPGFSVFPVTRWCVCFFVCECVRKTVLCKHQ